jgi:hypothetical protein
MSVSFEERTTPLPTGCVNSIAQIPGVIFPRISEDRLGQVFRFEGHHYRAVTHQGLGRYRGLKDSGLLNHLSHVGYIPKQSEIDLSDAKFALVMGADQGQYYLHWSFPLPMLKMACLAYLGMLRSLATSGLSLRLGLIDGHPANYVVFDNSVPKWVDLGSIQPFDAYEGQGVAVGLESFARHFILPLAAMTEHPSHLELIRREMREYASTTFGMPDRAADDEWPFEYSADALGLALLARSTIRRSTEPGIWEKLIDAVTARVEALDFSEVSGYWSSYYFTDDLDPDWTGDVCADSDDNRYMAVRDLIREVGCRTFLDVGSNKGRFSLIAIKAGLSGTAIDYDERSTAVLWDFLKRHAEIPLRVCVSSFPDHHHRAQLVLALAISHHLSLSQSFTFDEIAEHLRQMTESVLITEFMPDGLGGIASHPAPVPDPLPEWYTLGQYVESLRRYFSEVRVVDYERPIAPSRRVLIECRI